MDVVPEVDGRVKSLKQPEKVKQQDALHLCHGSVHLVQLRAAVTISVCSSLGGLRMRHLSTHLQAEAAHIADSEVKAVMDLRGTTSKLTFHGFGAERWENRTWSQDGSVRMAMIESGKVSFKLRTCSSFNSNLTEFFVLLNKPAPGTGANSWGRKRLATNRVSLRNVQTTSSGQVTPLVRWPC